MWYQRVKERTSVKQTFEEFDAAVGNMGAAKEAFQSGKAKREYRDHRLEWMIKSGGVDVVVQGLKDQNIRFSWPT